jgi:molecular chaperone DnaJ
MTFYERLGLAADATESEIKRAYRRLAKRFHPDTGEPGDAERFREIQEAYETLSDPDRRRVYDSGGRGPAPVSWSGGFEEPIPPWGAFREVTPRPRSQPAVHLDIVLSHAEARRGGEVVLDVPSEIACAGCRGRGLDFFGWCAECGGTGALRLYERLRFRIPAGVENGESTSARRADGTWVRARVRVD